VRITHLCSSGGIGGTEHSVLAMIRSVQAAEPSWAISAIAPEQASFLEGVSRLGSAAVALPFPAPLARFGEARAVNGSGRIRAAIGAAVYAARLRRALRRQNPQIVHAHGVKMQVLSGWATPQHVRLVWHVHDYMTARMSSARALRASTARVSAVVANSRSVAEDLRACVGVRVPIHIIYNAVDVDRFAPEGDRLDLDRLAGLPAAEPCTVRIGLTATFGRWKGQDVFLRALAQLPPGTKWRAYVIGDAVYQTSESQWSRDVLEAMARELGLGERVGFTGLVSEVPAALRSLDIAVHASTQPEPFGMTIAEAMACGRAVVVSMAGGAAEITRDRVDALGYAPGDDAALGRALAALVVDRDLRMALGEEARRTALASFDERRLGPELRRVYQSARPAA
jgi:glycosyltransferase involved in cell wall biosynthesis